MMVILLLWLGCMSFRPLSRGLSFNLLSFRLMAEKISRFRPLSWGLSFNKARVVINNKRLCFRPLSWGLSFNL